MHSKEKKNNNWLKYITYLVIVLQGIIFSLLSTYYLNENYREKLYTTPQDVPVIDIRYIGEDKTINVLNFLEEYANKNNILLVKTEDILDSKGYTIGERILLAGDYNSNKDKLDLSFMNQKLVKDDDINKLLSSNEDLSIGYESSSINMIRDIPKFVLGDNIVIKSLLPQTLNTNNINGNYRLVGAKQEDKDIIIKALSEITGISREKFSENLSGSYLDNSFKESILIGLFLLTLLLLFSLFIINSVRSIREMGIYILQGYSKKDYVFKIFTPFINVGSISSVMLVLYGLILTNFSFRSLTFISTMFLYGVVNFIIILLLVCVSSIVMLTISPIDAIKNRISTKKYIIMALTLFLLSNIAMVFMAIYIDGPYKEIEENKRLSINWKEVSDLYILNELNVGDDQKSFTRESKAIHQDFYDWYKSIEGKDGVYIINTSFTSDETIYDLKQKGVYKSLPDKAFWEFIASPNYLNKIGINIDDNVINEAYNGSRIYLIPSSYSNHEKNKMEKYILERDNVDFRDDDIKTAYMNKKNLKFYTYDNDRDLFTYNTSVEDSNYTKDPIINIVTSENMIFRESESINAMGLANSFVKLSYDAKNNYTNYNYLRKYNLSDNLPSYLPIEKHVDGIQKTLLITIRLFLSLIIMLGTICLILLYSSIVLFRIMNDEEINIKRFLGYTNNKIYKKINIFVIIVLLIDFIAVAIYKSKIGILLITLLAVIEFIFLYKTYSKNQFSKLLDYLKS